MSSSEKELTIGKAPAFQIYVQDFDMDTATWENDQVGSYLRLLFYEWINGGLPDDTYRLSKIVRETERNFKKNWEIISKKFILDGNGLLINKRLEEVRQNQVKYSESRRKNVSVRYKDKATYESTHEERMKTVCNLSSSSSSSSSLNIKEKDILARIPFLEIISFLNQKTGKSFSYKTKQYQRLIRARWNEGKRLEDFQKVVEIKCDKWMTDFKMVDYCRPETLFGTKMDSYLNESEPIPTDETDRLIQQMKKEREMKDE